MVIVGGGASGTLLAAQLLRNARGPLRVALLEKSGRMGPGLAYSTESASHLLNVPASRMSAFPDDPEHFLRWVRRVEPDTGPEDFVQRRRYGRYLEAVLREAREGAAPGVHLEPMVGEVVSISRAGNARRVELADGTVLEARQVVLAVGNALPADLPVADGGLYTSPRYIRSPWTEGALRHIRSHHSVMLIGTGLTMVDTVLSLAERGHEGRIHALSRHGLLPHVHRPGVVAGNAVDISEPRRVRSILGALRREVRSAREGGGLARGDGFAAAPDGLAVARPAGAGAAPLPATPAVLLGRAPPPDGPRGERDRSSSSGASVCCASTRPACGASG